MEMITFYPGVTTSTRNLAGNPKSFFLPSAMQPTAQAQWILQQSALTPTEAPEQIWDMCAVKYKSGTSAYKLAHLLGKSWRAEDVIVRLEGLNAKQNLILPLSEQEELDTLTWLRAIRLNGDGDRFHTSEHVRREVVASQRIEGIDARSHIAAT
jgi:hypothetical protein